MGRKKKKIWMEKYSSRAYMSTLLNFKDLRFCHTPLKSLNFRINM